MSGAHGRGHRGRESDRSASRVKLCSFRCSVGDFVLKSREKQLAFSLARGMCVLKALHVGILTISQVRLPAWGDKSHLLPEGHNTDPTWILVAKLIANSLLTRCPPNRSSLPRDSHPDETMSVQRKDAKAAQKTGEQSHAQYLTRDWLYSPR